MELTDVLPIDKWMELEKDVYLQSGLSANVFNTDGIRISDFHVWPNRLCPAVKATDKGQAFICAVAHMNLASQAVKTKQPVMEDCDAGMFKIVVPIFVKNEYIGAFGACGLLLEGNEVDSFLVNKITDIREEVVEDLSSDIASIPRERALELMKYISEKIKNITKAYEEKLDSQNR